MNGIYEFEDLVPVVDPTAYVHHTTVLIGDVVIGPRCFVGPNAVLRGDFGRIILEEGANLQDTYVMHSFPNCDTVVEFDGHIGHGAILHGCRIGRNAMVGMNAVVMDNAIVGEECIVAALAFVKANMQIPPRSLVAGIPGKVIRSLTAQEIAWKSAGTAVYRQLAQRSRATLRPAQPLAAVEKDRRLSLIQNFEPLFKIKQQAGDPAQE